MTSTVTERLEASANKQKQKTRYDSSVPPLSLSVSVLLSSCNEAASSNPVMVGLVLERKWDLRLFFVIYIPLSVFWTFVTVWMEKALFGLQLQNCSSSQLNQFSIEGCQTVFIRWFNLWNNFWGFILINKKVSRPLWDLSSNCPPLEWVFYVMCFKLSPCLSLCLETQPPPRPPTRLHRFVLHSLSRATARSCSGCLLLLTMLSTPMTMEWRGVTRERAARTMKRATWSITSAWWWKEDVRDTKVLSLVSVLSLLYLWSSEFPTGQHEGDCTHTTSNSRNHFHYPKKKSEKYMIILFTSW